MNRLQWRWEAVGGSSRSRRRMNCGETMRIRCRRRRRYRVECRFLHRRYGGYGCGSSNPLGEILWRARHRRGRKHGETHREMRGCVRDCHSMTRSFMSNLEVYYYDLDPPQVREFVRGLSDVVHSHKRQNSVHFISIRINNHSNGKH